MPWAWESSVRALRNALCASPTRSPHCPAEHLGDGGVRAWFQLPLVRSSPLQCPWHPGNAVALPHLPLYTGIGGSNSDPGEGRSLSSGCVIPLAEGKGRNLPFSKGFPDFPFSFTEQREKAVMPQGRTAPKGTPAFFNLLKGFWNFHLLRCCFSSRGIRTIPCSRGGRRLQLSGQL